MVHNAYPYFLHYARDNKEIRRKTVRSGITDINGSVAQIGAPDYVRFSCESDISFTAVATQGRRLDLYGIHFNAIAMITLTYWGEMVHAHAIYSA